MFAVSIPSAAASAKKAASEAVTAERSAQARLIEWWNDAQAWVDSHWLQISIAAAVALLVYLVLAWLRRIAVRRAAATVGQLSVTDIFTRVAAKTRSLVLAIVALRMVIDYADPPALVASVVHMAFIVAATLQVAIWAREVLISLIARRASESPNETLVNAMGIIRLLISVALFAVAAIIILDNVGVNVSALIAGLGIGGIAIGLAAQGIFSDLFAALSIIFDRPFSNGETIRYDQTTATVERVGLKSTRLRSVNGELLIISNTNLLNKEIANFARLERRRINFTIGVVYQTSPEKLRALPGLVERVVAGTDHHFVRSSFLLFGASSLDFEVVFDVLSDDVEEVAAGRTEVGIALFEALTLAGYEFAYPTQTTFTADPDGKMILPYLDPAAKS